MSVLPMFPLGSVLLPGRILTLHVFEPRYRQMVKDCLAASAPEFGVVLIERGSEVGGGDTRRDVGTVARMVQVAETPDGRYAVVAFGVRRLVVDQWLEDDPYPRAEVHDWPDTDPTPCEPDAALVARVRRAGALALELGDPVGDPGEDLHDNPEWALYQLALLAPLGLDERDELLRIPSHSQRTARLATMLDEVEPVLQFRLMAD